MLTYAGFLKTEQSVLADPNNKVTLAASQPSLSVGIGLFGNQRIELGIVVQAEIDLCILQRSTLGIKYLNINGICLGIAAGDVNLGVAIVATHNFLGSVVIAKDLGVHEHTTGSGLVEPTHIQYGKGFAGSHEVPAPVYPSLYPSVVVIGMRPAWGIDLTGRNAYSSECRNGKRAFLAATTRSGAHGNKGRFGTAVGRSVCDKLVTPMVDLQNGIVHILVLYTVLQGFVENDSGRVQILVIDTQGEYKMLPLALGNLLAPRHLLTGL